MRILYVSPFPPARDGIGTYTRILAGAVAGRGHEFRVIVPRPALVSPPEVIGAVGGDKREADALREALGRWRPDVVHVQFGVGAFGTRTASLPGWLDLLSHEFQVPVVMTMHEVTRDTALLRAAGRAFYRRLAGHCDRIIVHTDAALHTLTGPVRVPPGKAAVIPHLEVEPPAASTAPEELRARFGLGNATVLLAFGFIHVDKGLDDLVSAFGTLLRSSAPADVRLVVAGTVRPRQGLFRIMEAQDRLHFARVLRMARRSAVRPQMVLTGYVPEEDVAGWFRTADAAVLPYRRIEQSGVASLASAYSTPVLASTAGGLGEMFGSSRWSFPPGDPHRLASVLADFLRTPREERMPAARPRPDNSVTAVAAATVDVYTGVVPARAEVLSHAG